MLFIFLCFRNGDKIVLNKQQGYLLRTKPVGTDEGGVATGYSVLDSPYLVDSWPPTTETTISGGAHRSKITCAVKPLPKHFSPVAVSQGDLQYGRIGRSIHSTLVSTNNEIAEKSSHPSKAALTDQDYRDNSEISSKHSQSILANTRRSNPDIDSPNIYSLDTDSPDIYGPDRLDDSVISLGKSDQTVLMQKRSQQSDEGQTEQEYHDSSSKHTPFLARSQNSSGGENPDKLDDSTISPTESSWTVVMQRKLQQSEAVQSDREYHDNFSKHSWVLSDMVWQQFQ